MTNNRANADHSLTIPAQRFHDHGFSQEDIWHEMRAIGGDERQAIRSLIEAEARLDD